MDNDKNWPQRYLQTIEQQADGSAYAQHYLWPRTMLNAMQYRTWLRIGATDEQTWLPFSRPALINGVLAALRDEGAIPADFTILDIACGDALVMKAVKETYPEARVFGSDCNLDQFDTHPAVRAAGVGMHGGYLQDLFRTPPPARWDMAVMLNTYRGWESADLREHEQDLPELADQWLFTHARYAFLTVTEKQIRRFTAQGLEVLRIGRGEDNSIAVVVTRDGALPAWPGARLCALWWSGRIVARLARLIDRFRARS